MILRLIRDAPLPAHFLRSLARVIGEEAAKRLWHAFVE
jgi:hypothetical protein